jgi:phosphatidylglycerophosphatase A
MKRVFSQLGTRIAFLAPGCSVMKRLAIFIATAGGAGDFPYAPGTIGSVVGILTYLILGQLPWSLQLLVILLTLAISLWAVSEMDRETGLHDNPKIVVDEVLGMWLTLWAFPVSWPLLLMGFLLFRVLDIFKPFPASFIDRKLHGAVGVIGDDLMSGLYGQALLRLGFRLWGLT